MELEGLGAPLATETTSFNDNSILDKDDFLSLLVTQMRHQDPLNPMEATEFSSQLAEFTSVEQLANIEETLVASLDANYLLASSINNTMAATVIGKDVRALGSQMYWDGDTDPAISLDLAGDAHTVNIEIVDEHGDVIRTFEAGPLTAGESEITWDGLTDEGDPAEEGIYSVRVDAETSEEVAVGVTTFITGQISGVRYSELGPVLILGELEIGLGDVYEILNP